MVWTEFDEELYRKVCKQEDFEDGFEEGYNAKELEDKALIEEKERLLEEKDKEIESLKKMLAAQ